MLLGAIFGSVIVILILALIAMYGRLSGQLAQIKTLSQELTVCQISLGRYAVLEQERAKLRESVYVGFTEEQITTLANRMLVRVKTIVEAEQHAALNKLD